MCRSVVSVYVAVGSPLRATFKDAASAAGAACIPFSLFPFFFPFSSLLLFQSCFPPAPFFLPLFFFLPSRSSFSPFFVVPVPRRILILVHTGVEEERVSESDRRCGPADERYHPVMVYLNQRSGSSMWTDSDEKPC